MDRANPKSASFAGTGYVADSTIGSTTGSLSGMVSLSSETSLTHEEREVLFIQLQECLVSLNVDMGFSRFAYGTAHLAFVCCNHYVIDSALSSVYRYYLSLYIYIYACVCVCLLACFFLSLYPLLRIV